MGTANSLMSYLHMQNGELPGWQRHSCGKDNGQICESIHSFIPSLIQLNHVIDDSIIESLLCAGLWSRYVRFRHQNLRPVQGFESILSL